MGPGAVGRVSAIKDGVARRFKTVEPFSALISGIARPAPRPAIPFPPSALRQPVGDGRAFQIFLQRHDGEEGLGPGAGLLLVRTGRLLQPPLSHLLHQTHLHHPRDGAGSGFRSLLRADAQQFAVAQGATSWALNVRGCTMISDISAHRLAGGLPATPCGAGLARRRRRRPGSR